MQTIEGLIAFDRKHPEHQGTSLEEKLCLYGIVRQVAPNRLLEVGSWRGHSACWLSLAQIHNRKGGTLTCVDDFSGKQCDGGGSRSIVEKRLRAAKVAEGVEIVEQSSTPFFRSLEENSYDLTFVDASHDYDQQLSDILEACRVSSKLVLVHDACSVKGTIAACRQFLQDKGRGAYITGWRGLFLVNPRSYLTEPSRNIITKGTWTGNLQEAIPTPEEERLKKRVKELEAELKEKAS